MPRITDSQANEAWDLLLSKYDGRLAMDDLTFPGTRDQVKAIFNCVALTLHPDQGGDADEFMLARKAQGILLLYQEQENPPVRTVGIGRKCPHCDGQGYITMQSSRIGSKGLKRQCLQCHGSGDADYDAHGLQS